MELNYSSLFRLFLAVLPPNPYFFLKHQKNAPLGRSSQPIVPNYQPTVNQQSINGQSTVNQHSIRTTASSGCRALRRRKHILLYIYPSTLYICIFVSNISAKHFSRCIFIQNRTKIFPFPFPLPSFSLLKHLPPLSTGKISIRCVYQARGLSPLRFGTPSSSIPKILVVGNVQKPCKPLPLLWLKGFCTETSA